jgi:hypothetical protein
MLMMSHKNVTFCLTLSQFETHGASHHLRVNPLFQTRLVTPLLETRHTRATVDEVFAWRAGMTGSASTYRFAIQFMG